MEYFNYEDISEVQDFDLEEIDVEDFLEKSQEDQKQRLESELESIEEELERRETIYDENMGELRSKLEWYIERLDQLYKRSIKKSERRKLKGKIEDLYSEIRSEKVDRWRDLQKLEKEKRDVLRELSELEDSCLEDFSLEWFD